MDTVMEEDKMDMVEHVADHTTETGMILLIIDVKTTMMILSSHHGINKDNHFHIHQLSNNRDKNKTRPNHKI